MTLEYIKKIMGWCPNAKKLETGPRISSADFETYGQLGEEKARSPEVSGPHSRLYTQLLLLPMFFAPVYVNLFQKGINTEAFLLGLLLSLPIYLFGWKKQIHQYDAAKEKPVISPFFRKIFFYVLSKYILGWHNFNIEECLNCLHFIVTYHKCFMWTKYKCKVLFWLDGLQFWADIYLLHVILRCNRLW